MLDFIFKPIIAGITAVATIVGGLFGMVPDNKIAELENQISKYELQLQELQLQIDESQNLGSYYAVGGKYYRLWGSGITSSANTLILTSFKSPINDQEFTISNFGEFGFGVIEPDNTSNIEYISFSGITQDASSDKATLTGVARGLNFVYPYNASTTLQKSHAGGSRFIIADPPMHFGEFAAKRNAETIYGDWTFSATSTPQYNNNPTFTSGSKEFASVKFAEDQANQGAATISTTTPGIGLIATSEVLISFTTTTGYASSTPWLLRAFDAATSTDKRGATTTIMLTDTNGKMDQSFMDLTEDFTYTGDVYFNASTTIGNASSDSLTVNASSTFTALVNFSGNATTTFESGALFNSTSTRFAGFPLMPNATPTDAFHPATKNYVDVNVLEYISVISDTYSTTTSAWGDWLVAASSTDVTGAKFIEIHLATTDSLEIGARKNGSSIDRRFSNSVVLTTEVDANGFIEVYGVNASDTWRVVGIWR